MDAWLSETATTFGFGALIGVMILVAWFRSNEMDKTAYNKLVEQMATVIQNNSAVMAKVEQVLEASCVSMAKHDARAENIQAIVERLEATAERIESKMDRAYETMAEAKTERKIVAARR